MLHWDFWMIMFHILTLMTQHLRYKVITVVIHYETQNSVGKLGAVINLSCKQNDLCIECTWVGPFSLTQPIHYIINFTSNKGYVATLTTMNTTISHCLCGEYNISVAASNTVGLGDVKYKTVTTLMQNCMPGCFYKFVNFCKLYI